MKKSRAANVFNKGMIMDLNPIVTPNDVMTNCLNGTLVTFNGNENVLQNDMGNGRVETAYLPEGYVPLGTAELGGIVYIVSYNPLNNKCQIGSFPSPERNVSSSEIQDNSIKITNNQFVDSKGKVINTLVKVKLLEGDYDKLNPGDKFAIYSTNEGIKSNIKNISDVGSSIHKVDNDPRYVTIHVVSIGEDGKITYLDDNLKWDSNTNYYIKDCNGKDAISTDIDDYRTLVSSAYNVFSSKVPGELALIFELKTIDSLSITWDASVQDYENGNKQATVTFDTNWTSSNPKINIDSLVLSSSSFTSFSKQDISVTQGDVCYVESSERKNDGTDNPTKVTVGTFNYNAEKNLQDYVWHYQVTPAMKFGTLDYLSTSGSINFSEIGSGKIEVDEWRYYIQENSFFLNWGLEAYPEKNKSIDQVSFTFIPFDKVTSECSIWGENQQDIETYDLSQYVVSGKSSFSGNFQDLIKFNSDSKITGKGILKNSLYLVNIGIKYGDTSSSSYIHYFRWIYTTGQWNNKFLDTTIKDFNTLTLEDVFDITADIQVNDTIEYDDSYYYPQLYLDENPEDNGKFSSMGVHTISVNYDKDSSSFSESGNVEVKLTVHPDKYQDLFSFNDQYTQYTNSIQGKEITYTDITIDSENGSGISEAVKSYFMNTNDPFPDNFADSVRIAQTGSITQDNNSNLKDSFNATIVDGNNAKNINLCIKGAIFSRINAGFQTKEQIITQTVRPILQSKSEYSNFNFNSDGNFQTIFTEDHKNHSNGKQSFIFEKIYWPTGESSPLLNNSEIQGEKEKIYSKEAYWEVGNNAFDTYIYPNMKAVGNPFCIVRMGVGGNSMCIGLTDQKYYDAKYSFGGNTFLWARLDDDRFVPINAYWPTSSNPDQNIAQQLRVILMQIYYVDTNEKTINKFVVDDINYLKKYTEKWNVIINTTLKISSYSDSIYLNNSISLKMLQGKTPKDVDNTNITYTGQENLNISNSFEHTFKCDNTKLYSKYTDCKTIGTQALYEISTKNKVEYGNALNPDILYVYTESEKFQPLGKDTSKEIIPNGTITATEDNRLIFAPTGSGVPDIEMLGYLKFNSQNKKVYFSQDLLNKQVWFYYISEVEDNEIKRSMNIKSNSDYYFIIGNHR